MLLRCCLVVLALIGCIYFGTLGLFAPTAYRLSSPHPPAYLPASLTHPVSWLAAVRFVSIKVQALG